MTLSVSLHHRFAGFTLDADFEAPGGVTALFGRSGSGKSTVANAVAGLLRPDRGRIALEGTVLLNTGLGLMLPPHRRRMGYVFQDGRLFPHLTVRQNLLYGRWFAGRGPGADMGRVVDMLGIGALLERRPGGLSGGEKQRVAIGRAILANPRLLLMDEPLAALDEARKAEILPYLERLRDGLGLPILYVSHSVAEVARLATDVVVLASGRVTACGAAGDILRRLDLLPEDERGEGGAVLDMIVAGRDDAYGMAILRSAAGEIRVPGLGAAVGTAVRLRIRARDVMLATERPTGLSALNVLAGRVAEVIGGDGVADIMVDCGGQIVASRITRRSRDMLGIEPGTPVFAVVKTVSFEGAFGGVAAPVDG